MTAFLRFLLLAALALAAPAMAQDAGGSSAYAIGGIDVDVAAKNPGDARMAAYRIAERKAWPQLWERLTGQGAATAPRLSDGQLDQIVAGIESQGERFSMTRYIARLGVVFDRSRASAYLGGVAGALHAPPMLLLPVFADGGARFVYQAKTPWRAAWQRWKEAVTPLDYVLASGSAGDNILLTAYQVTRPDRTGWRNILNRFEAVDVLTAEVRLMRRWPGGPIDAHFVARHGPDATELGRFDLRAEAETGLEAMLDAGVRRIDEIYAQALRDGRLRSEPDLSAELAPIVLATPVIGGDIDSAATTGAGGVEIDVPTPDPAAVAAIESLLRSTPTVTAVTITSLSLGGTSKIVVAHADSYEMLLYQLDQKGWRIESQAGATVLRRRREGEVPVPRPATAADLAGAEAVAEPDGAGGPVPSPGRRDPAVPPTDPRRDPVLPPPRPAAAPADPGSASRAGRSRTPPPAAPPAVSPALPAAPPNAPVDLLPRP